MTPALCYALALLATHLTPPDPQDEVTVVTSPPTELYVDALRKGAQGNLASARRELSAVLRTDPRHTSARLRLDILEAAANHVIDDQTATRLFQAVLYSVEGRTQEALALLDSVVTAVPTYAEAYRLRGRTRIDIRDYELAIRDYSEAIRRRPEFAQAYLNRANAYVYLRRLDLAMHDYDDAVCLSPLDADAYSTRGAALSMLGRPLDAIRDFDHAILLNPGLGPAYINKAVLYEQLGRLVEAAATYETLIRHANLADSASVARAKRRLRQLPRG